MARTAHWDPVRVCDLRPLCSILSAIARIMGASAAAGLHVVVARPCASSPGRMFMSRTAFSRINLKGASQGLANSSSIFSIRSPCERYSSKYCRVVTRAMSGESEERTAYGLPIDLRGIAFFVQFPLSLTENLPIFFSSYLFLYMTANNLKYLKMLYYLKC